MHEFVKTIYVFMLCNESIDRRTIGFHQSQIILQNMISMSDMRSRERIRDGKAS